MTDGWAILAALATTVSALVIAWQAIETRRAANQARKSVEQAEISAQAARDAVAVSEQILHESQKARIDAGVPRIIVKLLHDRDITAQERTDRGPEPIRTEETFVLPRDANRRIYVYRTVHILNEGPGSAIIQFNQPLGVPTSDSTMITSCALSADEGVQGTYTIERPVHEWITIAEAFENHGSGFEDIFTVMHTGPRDAEAVENITVRTGGTVVERVHDAQGIWRLSQPITLNSGVDPVQRTYWQSRTKLLRFP